jgi:hypothetical protein
MRRLPIPLLCVWLWLGAGVAACELRVARAPLEYRAVVVGLSPPEETARQTAIAIARTGGAPTPRYRPLPRILADFTDERGLSHRIISAVTDGRIPPPGSRVVLRSRYLDPDDDCQFIPWTVKPTDLID